MGKSNNPAKRATQEAEIKAKKARGKRGAGFLKFVLVLVLSVAICGPFFAGLATISSTPSPAITTTAPAAPANIPATVAPATAPAPVPATVVPATTPAAPAGQ